jgi:uncharacterized protein (DUF697 family)
VTDPRTAGDASRPDEAPDAAAARVIRNYSITAAAAAVQPIPGIDLALLTPIQVGMVRTVAAIYGHPLGLRTALELLGAFGTGLATQQAIIAAVKFVPMAGLPVAISVAYAITYAIGEATRVRFAHDQPAATKDLREVFRRAYRGQRRAIRRAASDEPLARELRQLGDARRSGQLAADEYERRKQALIARVV